MAEGKEKPEMYRKKALNFAQDVKYTLTDADISKIKQDHADC
ncbi:hypothetical protein [Heliobacterium chlorum]|nr:hypothetical protein [Heliobacterium chlorum]